MKKLKEILLVDDDQTNNFLNRSLLRGLNMVEEITVLVDGKQAFNYLHALALGSKQLPELVILDHFMPVMDGMELMQELNKTGLLKRHHIVFILLAAHTNQRDIEEFEKLGVQEYTSKPLSEEVVISAHQKYFADDTAKDHTAR